MFVKARKNINPDPKTLPSNDFESYEKQAYLHFKPRTFKKFKNWQKIVWQFWLWSHPLYTIRKKLGSNNEAFQWQNILLDKPQKLIVPALLSENRNRILSKILIDYNDQLFTRKVGKKRRVFKMSLTPILQTIWTIVSCWKPATNRIWLFQKIWK